MRFAVGVTAAFVLCEAMQWIPSFLGPIFTVALLANLPVRPPLKMSLVLVVTMTLAALFAYALASLLRGTPTVLFGALALTMFMGFHAIASGRPTLPFILLLICVATIPVIVMIAPAQAEAFPKALIRGMAVAVLMIGFVYVPWPHAPVRAPAPKPEERQSPSGPLIQALLSTAVVMPLMLAYLLLGLADALPVIITTVLLVITFDVQKGRQQAMRHVCRLRTTTSVRWLLALGACISKHRWPSARHRLRRADERPATMHPDRPHQVPRMRRLPSGASRLSPKGDVLPASGGPTMQGVRVVPSTRPGPSACGNRRPGRRACRSKPSRRNPS